ncbi:class I SAM-dependent methyltransferase [Nocardioides sp. T2.26MG-1]|uniref:class I SAM-dependent methyltransferase n=1 Tax=Nocardioides sp. T2.26MG-1 TaxID=3041166 RepID=UPI002477A2EB|nr:class I SAM-dependent methyltransferase [Nocardioides sp. T2.26MG-1]CAI9403265.1 Ubiquinone biosynthesis O-methyltransferase, mitochondrial [Nocardioides sp. T2.26MG-1]
MSDYTTLLNSLLPNFFWFRDGHFQSGDGFRVRGTVVLGPKLSPGEIEAFVNGERVPWRQLESAYAEDKFWFVPESRRFGVELTVPARPDLFNVTICPTGTPEAERDRFTFAQYASWDSIDPTPPVANIERVSGKGATAYNYHNNGRSDYLRFVSIAAQYSAVGSEHKRILDWGCGCGRLSRHYQESGADITGIDIDPYNVAWCSENLHPGRFETVDLMPPTSLPEDTFDVVFANSVLSHLTAEAMDAWLHEISRILRPGGLALLSYHGDFSLLGFASRTESFVRQVLHDGFNSQLKANEVNDVISDPEYYRHTFMTDEHAMSLFRSHFAVREQITGVVSRFQNLAVLSRET